MPVKPTTSTQDMLQAAEQYLAQTESYQEVTVQHLARFLGVGIMIVYRWLPTPQWERLRNTWIQERLRWAMDMACAEAISQDDFTMERIAHFAKMPLNAVHRFLHEDEWKAHRGALHITQERCKRQEQPSINTQYIHNAEIYLAQVEKYEEVTLKHFAKFLGEAVHIVYKRLPSYQWEQLRNTWIEKHLRQALDTAYAEARTQDDFTLKDIIRHAGMPYITVCRFLPTDEWMDKRATLPMSQRKAETAALYMLQAETYLAQTQDYEAVTVKGFAEYLGVSNKTVSHWIPKGQWEALRNKWIENRLKQSIAAQYEDTENQSDFTVEAIARHTGIPSKMVSNHLSVGEWQEQQRETLPPNQTASLCSSEQKKILPSKPSIPLGLLHAMDQVYAEAKTQGDFTMSKIAALAGVSGKVTRRYIGKEWQTRRETLPTTKEKILAALQKMVDDHTPVSELTRKRIVELADVNGDGTWHWLSQPLNDTRRQLALLSRDKVADPPLGMNVRVIPGGWIDINANIWDLRPSGKHVLRRDRLREDFAEVGWPLLQKELRSPEIALGTTDRHYQGLLKAGTIFGEYVPDVRRATLETVQKAWMNFNGTRALFTMVRLILEPVFEALMRLAEQNDAIEGREMFRIFVWLNDAIKVGRSDPGEEFLSESDLNAVIQGCLTDIIAGMAYADTNSDLLAVSSHPLARGNAAVVVQWAEALMILLMAFTGLRRESILELKIGDWAEVHSGLYILAWHHNKKLEENVVVLPALLAQQLQRYVQYTVQVRAELETEFVFLGSSSQGLWKVIPITQFSPRLHNFVKRHHLERAGKGLPLSSTILRRTYVTRALYEGRNLAALRAQLGHMYFDTTLRYAKFDQYEHPTHVGTPLDEYGRKALTLWHTPLILDELDPTERASLLRVKVEQEQDVGLCRHSHCMKAVMGSPPPCSLCEHLVTGPEFLDAWDAEHRWRKHELERYAVEPGSEMMLAQMKFQFERFEANFISIQRRFRS